MFEDSEAVNTTSSKATKEDQLRSQRLSDCNVPCKKVRSEGCISDSAKLYDAHVAWRFDLPCTHRKQGCELLELVVESGSLCNTVATYAASLFG